jgi:hypothetical protein
VNGFVMKIGGTGVLDGTGDCALLATVGFGTLAPETKVLNERLVSSSFPGEHLENAHTDRPTHERERMYGSAAALVSCPDALSSSCEGNEEYD